MNEEISKTILKSNTSLVAIKCTDGIVMGADRRATAGTLVAKKTETKLEKINDYLVVSWTGGVSDAQLSAKLLSAELRLKELKTKSRPSIKEAANLIGNMLYRSIRSPSMIPYQVGLLAGGVNEDGSTELYTISPDGVVWDVKDYDANFSSGMPYILGLLERQYKSDITVKEAIELAKEALKSAMERDTGSGNGIDVFTVTKEGIDHVVSETSIPTFK
jgi:proteasome beta subunit